MTSLPIPPANMPEKKLRAVVILTMPDMDCDPQAYETYDTEKMAAILKAQLQDNLIETIEGPYSDDLLGVEATVQVVTEDDKKQ